MALRINTNIAAMNAHKNMIKTDNALSESLGRLSSGLRINKAADDASGMGIADSLRSQSLGLGQAIRNGNDGISIVQTADAALEESINIVNMIKQKSIQSAQDGQTTDSRKAIQADITKLRDELDIIAKTTSFNNQKLLSGNFTNKKFQIGAYSGETIDISIQSSEAGKIGHVSTSDLTFASEGTAELAIYSNQLNETFNLNSFEIAYDNTRENGIGAVADAINVLSDKLGITASASVTSTTDGIINAGTTGDNFAINGIKFGAIVVSENDSSTLVTEINQKTDQHGVIASLDRGFLTLTSTDDRAIEVTQDAATTAVLGNTTSMSTLGTITLTQQGSAAIDVSNRAGGAAVAVLDDRIDLAGVTTTKIDSELASGSVVMSGSTVSAGSVLSTGTVKVETSGAVSTTGTSVVGSGSVISSGSTIAANTTLTGQINASGATITATGVLGSGSTFDSGSVMGAGTVLHADNFYNASQTGALAGQSTLTQGSVLTSGSTLVAGSYMLTSDYDVSEYTSATVNTSGAYTIFTQDAAASGDVTYTTGGVTLAAGSDIESGSTFKDGSVIGGDFSTSGANTTATEDMTLLAGSALSGAILQEDTNLSSNLVVAATTGYTLGADMTLEAGSTLTSGSTLGDDTALSDDFINADAFTVVGNNMELTAGSSLTSGSVLTDGSSIGADITLVANEIVDKSTDMRLAAGSSLAAGSTITAGTFLTNDVLASDGVTYTAGSELGSDIITAETTTMTNTMTLGGGSILLAGSTLAANGVATDDASLGSTAGGGSYRLSDLDVTTQEGAQIAISIADAALKNLDKVRSDLGSVQNQLTSTIANISTTRVNVAAAESTIRDVDFAEESSNFTKMQILAQAGTFAMSQANSSAQGVLSLLQ